MGEETEAAWGGWPAPFPRDLSPAQLRLETNKRLPQVPVTPCGRETRPSGGFPKSRHPWGQQLLMHRQGEAASAPGRRGARPTEEAADMHSQSHTSGPTRPL